MRKKLLIKVAFIVGGAIIGYLYYYFIGCVSGTCAITSNPIISTLYCAVLGFLLSMIFAKPEKKKDE